MNMSVEATYDICGIGNPNST